MYVLHKTAVSSTHQVNTLLEWKIHFEATISYLIARTKENNRCKVFTLHCNVENNVINYFLTLPLVMNAFLRKVFQETDLPFWNFISFD